MNRIRRRQCSRRERGSVIVESALINTVVLAMIVLTFDAALVIFLIATFNHAAREGARYAITYQRITGLGQDASIKKKVVDSSMGFLTPEHVVVEYFDPKSPSPNTPIPAPKGNEPDNIVVVRVSGFSWAWMFPTGILPGRNLSALSISGSSADRMEALGVGQTPPPR